LETGGYLVLTMHRPASVDDPSRVQGLLEVICGQAQLPVVFPVHPRTRDKLGSAGERFGNLILVPPLGYLNFIYLVRDAKGVVSDSGGISEETTYLDVPCITLRENTERPETVTQGSNRLVGHDHDAIRRAMADLMAGNWPRAQVPEKWDGRAAVRIAEHLKDLANG
jgi:UDP-N-acetylglucosamine 2-epimerase (non-hydrolysing)